MHYIHVGNQVTIRITPTEITFPKPFTGTVRFIRADVEEDRNADRDHADIEAFRGRRTRILSRTSTPENPLVINHRDIIALLSDSYAYTACPDCGEKLDSIDYSCYQRTYGRADMTYGEPDNHETNDYGDADDYEYNCPHCGDQIDPFGLPFNIEMPMWQEFHRFMSDLFVSDIPTINGQQIVFTGEPIRPPRQARPTWATHDTPEAVGMPIDELAEEAEDLISQP